MITGEPRVVESQTTRSRLVSLRTNRLPYDYEVGMARTEWRRKALAPGFCVPDQIKYREWNHGAVLVDFAKRTNSIPFRLDAHSDFKDWNPQNRDRNSIPARASLAKSALTAP